MTNAPGHTLSQDAGAAFEAAFGTAPDLVSFAPGRVNLLGEHTDYNGGFVLPMTLGLGAAIAVGRGAAPGTLDIASANFDDPQTRQISETATGQWSDYILGSFKLVAADKVAEDGLKIMVTNDLPVGAGLSSSAAIEVGVLRACRDLFGSEADPVQVAKLARSVENDFVGMPCGIMDQFAVSVGTPFDALFLNTRTLEHRKVPLPGGHRLIVIHSGVAHKLTDDGYANRVKECNSAAALLGVEVLSDLGVNDLPKLQDLPETEAKRARHIITENQRVLDGVDALANDDATAFGQLMVASHASQRDDYAVSLPEIDVLVDAAMKTGAVGTRLTGGGFGGSIVVLATNETADSIADHIKTTFPRTRILT